MSFSFLLSLVLLGCPSAQLVDPLKDPKIDFQRVSYRTGNASSAFIGSIGYLSGAGLLGGRNTYQRLRIPDYENLELSYEGDKDELVKRTITASFLANVKAKIKKQIEADAKAKVEVVTEKDLKVHYYIISIKNPYDIIDSLNKDKKSMDALKSKKDKSRIITRILIAYGYKSSESIKAMGDADIKLSTKGKDGTLAANAKGDVNKTIEIKLSDGFIIGYVYSILCWEKDENGKLVIASSTMDVYGRSQSCTTGEKDPSKL